MDLRNDNYGDGSYVAKTFRRALRLLPKPVQKLLEEMYQSQIFPSAATVSRANLFLDVSFMRLLADRHEKLVNSESIFFGLSDASPIGRFFYQISEYFCFGGTGGKQELVEIVTATCHLRSVSKRPEDITVEYLSVMDRLMRVVRAFPPMCVE